MGVGKSTELVVAKEAMGAFSCVELLEGVLEAVEVLVVEEAEQLGVEASDYVVAYHNVHQLRLPRPVRETQDFVAVLVTCVVAYGKANNDPESSSVLVVVCYPLLRVDPIEGRREPGDKPGDIRLDSGRVLVLGYRHT